MFIESIEESKLFRNYNTILKRHFKTQAHISIIPNDSTSERDPKYNVTIGSDYKYYNGSYYGGYYKANFTIYEKDILNYFEAHKEEKSLNYVAEKFITKEFLHIMLGHYSKKYKDYDKEILNIAANLEVNSLLKLRDPLENPEKYNLPQFCTTDYYYEKLLEMLENQNNQNEENDNSDNNDNSNDNNENNENQQDQNNNEQSNENKDQDNQNDESNDNKNKEQNNDFGEQNDQNSSNELGEENEEKESSDLDRGNTLHIDNLINNFNYDCKFTNENFDYSDTEVGSFNVFNNILNNSTQERKKLYNNLLKNPVVADIVKELNNHENKVDMIATEWERTYFKLNNRRQSNDDLIYPGRKRIKGGAHKHFGTASTLFVDVSGSTRTEIYNSGQKETIWDYLYAIAEYLHKETQCNVVFYNRDVCYQLKSSDRFIMPTSRGGTSIMDTVTNYTANGEKLNRCYVLSDGEDKYKELLTNWKEGFDLEEQPRVWMLKNDWYDGLSIVEVDPETAR